MVAGDCHSSYMGSINRRTWVQAGLFSKESKNNWRCSQVVEHLPSKSRALSSNPGAYKKNGNETYIL
jgi:hypothetical protein